MTLRKIALALSVLTLLIFSAAAQKDVYNVSKQIGMTPGVVSIDSGVRDVPVSSSANIAGGWTLNLDNTETKSLKLTLYQNNDAVFGSGDITVSGNTNPVSAGGTLQGSSLILYVIPSGEPSLYRIDVIVGPGSMTGSYVFSTQAATQQPGSASGSLTEASVSIPITTRNVIVATQVGAGQTNAQKPQGPKGTAV
ncbi:Uncharacterised protein [uncultured archaeon]|nr:Uncharacterised protein [uncultured archaeon]